MVEVAGEDEADEAGEVEDSRFVAFSNKEIVGTVQTASTFMTSLLAQTILKNDQRLRLNNNKLKPTTIHGRD